MLGDGTIGSWWRRIWPLGARRDRPPANDAMFINVMADFSRQLSERVARQSAGGLAGAQQERREALRAYERKRRRQQMVTAGVAVGALAALGIASLAPPTAPPLAAPQPVAAAPTEPSPPVMVAAAQPTVLPDTQPAAPATEPAPSSTAAPAAALEPLRGEEVREVQKRLQGFGFNPGPADGVAGRMTAAAVMNYQQSRGQARSGDIDRDLLEQLRQDPAPQVAPPPPVMRTAHRAPRPTRSANPLDHLGRWLDSLVR